ncbi:MAG: GatB/YqeY domain-containing protein [Hyphomicrobiales bacterium]|nr:GatB/YqeY domain-containing protein [Hyphomicrobiales bacterium]
MREELNAAVKAAMKAGEKERLSTLRMMTSALKDKDIAARTDGKGEGVSDAEATELFAKLVKSREDSAKLYDDGGRPELAAKERAEIAVIREFMPRQMDEAEAREAIGSLVAELGAAGPKDMGRVMAALKERFAGKMDFSKASGLVKAALVG